MNNKVIVSLCVGIPVLLIIFIAVFLGISANNNSRDKCEKAGFSFNEDNECVADDDYAYDKIVMVVGNHANSPKPEVTKDMRNYLKHSMLQYNGKPDIAIQSAIPGGEKIDIEFKKVSGNTSKIIKSIDKNIDSKIKTVLSETSPDADGADYFNTVITAARSVKKSDNGLVLVFGSGLSDVQPLNFANQSADLLHSNPSEVVDRLKEEGLINPGDLSGVTIFWTGLGSVSGNQPSLDASERSNLEQIYRRTFQFMGANLEVDPTIISGDSIPTPKKVEVTKVNGTSGGLRVFKFDENSVKFNPDNSTFVDENESKNALKTVYDEYKKCRSNVSVLGYTAKTIDKSIAYENDLSRKRAEAVKEMLISLGVNDNDIKAEGRGSSDFEGRLKDISDAGERIEENATKNRVVIVSLEGACR